MKICVYANQLRSWLLCDRFATLEWRTSRWRNSSQLHILIENTKSKQWNRRIKTQYSPEYVVCDLVCSFFHWHNVHSRSMIMSPHGFFHNYIRMNANAEKWTNKKARNQRMSVSVKMNDSRQLHVWHGSPEHCNGSLNSYGYFGWNDLREVNINIIIV